jgi:DNA polymerase-3 subunit delta'
VTVLEPEGAAGMIKVGRIREAVKLAYMTGSLGGARVFRVMQADAMNEEASNALLKVIEEPPQGSFFVLETSAPGRLLPTLVSRLRMITVKPPGAEELAQYATSVSLDVSRFTRAALLLGEPLAPEQNTDRCDLAEQVLDAMQAVRHGQDPELAAKAFVKKDAEAILTTMSRVIEACIRAPHDAHAAEILQLTDARPSDAMLFQLHDRVQEVRRQAVQRIHVNVPMALGMLFSGWAFIWSKVPQ